MANNDISKCWYSKVCKHRNKCNTQTCIKYLEVQYLMDSSNIPKAKQQPITLDGSEDYEAYMVLSGIKTDIVNRVNCGLNIFICSSKTGNGKTSWAIKLLQKYFDEIWAGNGFRTRALFVHVPALLLQLKDFNNPVDPEFKQALSDSDVVVWDDIAGTDLTSYDYGQLLLYIDYRLSNNKSNIFTSNCTTKRDLEKSVGIKLASRIWNCSEIVEFKGNDRRDIHGSIADSV